MSCAASVDGLYVAIARDRELSLYSVEPFAEIARASLGPSPSRTLAFVGRQILVHEGRRLRVFSVQRLAPTADVTIPEDARLLATSHHYAMFARPGELLIANCTSDVTTVAPTRAPSVQVQFAAGLENAKFIAWPTKGPGEMWDASSRIPGGRIALELPADVVDVGTTAKQRSIWIATRSGDLITSRLSDGKSTVAPLPKTPHRIASHPHSGWFVMDFDGEPHAVNSVLRTWHRLAIPADRPRVIVPSIGSQAFVIVDDGTQVSRHDVSPDAVASPRAVPIGGPLPEGDEVVVPKTPPTPIVRVKQAVVEVEPSPAPPSEAPREAGPSRLAERFGRRSAEPATEREPAHKPFARSEVGKPTGDWREALFRWSKYLAEKPQLELPTVPSPLQALGDRAELDTPPRRILHVLYADWLAGHGDAGIAASRLSEIAGPTAWEEALGNGQLGKRAFVRSEAGRCLLARHVGAFLDGREPDFVKRIDGVRSTNPEPGTYRVRVRAGESDEDCARRLATLLGTVGFRANDQDIAIARSETWLRGWPLVVRGDAAADAGETVVMIVDGDGEQLRVGSPPWITEP